VTGREQDPWGDLTWSDGEAAAAAPTTPSAPSAASDEVAGVLDPAIASAAGAPRTCPWCATPAPDEATRCTSCGAALAQRESIGDLVVPGLTDVDPAIKDLDGRPLHLRGPSPTQSVASGLVVAAVAGGPVGLAILGGVGAVAAAEYLGAAGEQGRSRDSVGETSGAVLQALERLERGEALPTASDTTPRPGQETATTPAPDGSQEDTIDGPS